MNAGATLVVAGKAPDLTAGVALAATMIDTGAARAKLSDLVAITHRAAP
jgi:anthranilate phosphoribosyltransferase